MNVPPSTPGATRPCVLLDRDGTIIVERHYLSSPDQVELVPGAGEGLREMADMGCRLIVVTNQSGIGRGYFSEADMHRVHERIACELAAFGVAIERFYFCPHTPEDDCACRKPKPAMAEQAARELGIDLALAVMIGDKPCDIDLGHQIGATTILVRSGYGASVAAAGSTNAHFIANDLLDAARFLGRRVTKATISC